MSPKKPKQWCAAHNGVGAELPLADFSSSQLKTAASKRRCRSCINCGVVVLFVAAVAEGGGGADVGDGAAAAAAAAAVAAAAAASGTAAAAAREGALDDDGNDEGAQHPLEVRAPQAERARAHARTYAHTHARARARARAHLLLHLHPHPHPHIYTLIDRGEHVLSPAVAPVSTTSYACVRLCVFNSLGT